MKTKVAQPRIVDDRELPREMTRRQGFSNEAAMTLLVFVAGTEDAAPLIRVAHELLQHLKSTIHGPLTITRLEVTQQHRHSRISLLRISKLDKPLILDAYIMKRTRDSAFDLQVPWLGHVVSGFTRI